MKVFSLHFKVKISTVFLLLNQAGSADSASEYFVDLSDNLRVISQGVAGIGILDRASSSAFAKSSDYKEAIQAYGAGSLRWPNAGHDNLLITHWDNDHTFYYSNGPFSTLEAGNIWDPYYNLESAADHSEVIDLESFVNVLNGTGADPIMMFTWRSAELWRNINGQNVFYRDPEPLRLDDSPMPQEEADRLSSRELQFLENNRQLKTYFDYGGTDYPVCQVGGEVFIGWEEGQKPWELYGVDRGVWIGETLHAYLEDLQKFARHSGYGIRLMAQFKEANSGGNEIPTPITHLQGELEKLINATGDLVSFYGCSMHYRHSFETWLDQANMTWGFIVDDGEGTAEEIRTWFENFTAAKGYPGIELIPHANGIGSSQTDLIPNDYNRFKMGLVNTQFIMELIEAGYPYACHYGGIKGEYTDNVGLKNSNSIAFMSNNGEYTYNPVLHATGLIGRAVMEEDDRPARLVAHSLVSGNETGKTQFMVIESSSGQADLAANGGNLDSAITQVLDVYVLNKRNLSHEVSVDFSAEVQNSFEVRRYSEGSEETAPMISDTAGVVWIDALDNSRLNVSAPPLSMTRVKVHILGDTGTSTSNRPPRFNSHLLIMPEVEQGLAYSGSLQGSAVDRDTGDESNYTKVDGPDWLSIASDGSFSGTPTNEHLGLNSFTVEVSDGKEVDQATLRITVIEERSDIERWRHLNFSAYEISRSQAEWTKDLDNDGLSNFEEYVFCANPRSGNKDNLIRLEKVNVNGQAFAEIAYARREAYSGLSYSLRQSADLSAWETVPVEAYMMLPDYPQSLGDGKELVRLRITPSLTEPGQSKNFFRVDVQ